ncbi:MAG: excinuclease ABC subunit UvrC [Longimicrobiaceae bacterium]
MTSSTPLERKLGRLPSGPGVYLMKDAGGEVLYVGKAKSLRPRVRSYFRGSAGHGIRLSELVRRTADVDAFVVESEPEALLLENNLIKEYQPRFNIRLRDDKSYPYIKVTLQEPFPRVFVTRRLVRDGGRYFGPYTDVGRMRRALELIRRVYTVRSCRYRLPSERPARPCLDYHLGQCLAPCADLQSEQEYRGMIQEVMEILEGSTGKVEERMRREMEEAAGALEFERAARLRDALRHLEHLEARQRTVDVSGADRDVVGLARDGDSGCGVVLKIREGRLLGRETQLLSNLAGASDSEALSAFATRFYGVTCAAEGADLPPEILFPSEFEDRPALEALLRERSGHAVRTRVPRRGEKVRLIELAGQNARHLLEERRLMDTSGEGRTPGAVYDLQAALELGVVPRTLVCFDVSHTSGTETVGAAVTFENGEPDKSGYRRFRVKGEAGNDDYLSMREVVTRYFRRRLEENEPLPDLAVIDGGKGQLGAALGALEELDLPQQAVVGLAKREEEIFAPGRAESVRLSRRSPALKLLQRLRDEAHRFALEYNRKLRAKRTVRSELADVPGVGPARQRVLLEHFGSVRAMRAAGPAEIAAVPGVGPGVAARVVAHLAKES